MSLLHLLPSGLPPINESEADVLSTISLSREVEGERRGYHPRRLTAFPIRLKRAKRRVPAPACELSRPPKTFKRLEKFQEHQIPPQRPNVFTCSYSNCGKAFHREDLLLRHCEKYEHFVPKKLELPGSGLEDILSFQAHRPNSLSSSSGVLSDASAFPSLNTARTSASSWASNTFPSSSSLSSLSVNGPYEKPIQTASWVMTTTNRFAELDGASCKIFTMRLARDLEDQGCQHPLSALTALLPSHLGSFFRRLSQQIRGCSENLAIVHGAYYHRVKIAELVIAEIDRARMRRPRSDIVTGNDGSLLGKKRIPISLQNLNGTESFPDSLTSTVLYDWLLMSISKSILLETPRDRATDLTIRSALLEGLSGLTSYCQVSFSVLAIDSWLEQQYAADSTMNQNLREIVTLVGTETYAYITTCGIYAQTVWPLFGSEILDFISSLRFDQACGESGNLRSITLYDGTKLEACLEETLGFPSRTQAITVEGFFDSVVEVGEMLAWLNTTLGNLESRAVVARSQPIFTSMNHLLEESAFHGKIEITYFIAACYRSFETKKQPGDCWIDLLRETPLVMGYPIPKRPRPDTGVEISLPLLAALTGCEKLVVFSGKHLLKGFSTAIIPTEASSGFVYWHLISNENGAHLDYIDPRIQETFRHYPIELTLEIIDKSRHILGWCAKVKNYTGAPEANYEIQRSKLKRLPPGYAFEKVSLVGGMFITAGTSVILGKNAKAVHLRGRDDYIMRLKWISNQYVILFDVNDRRAWLVDGLSAVLHLVRASLKHDSQDSFNSLFRFDSLAFHEASWCRHSGKDSAIEILTNPKNLSLPLYTGTEKVREEVTESNVEATMRNLSNTKSNYCFKDRVNSICDTLEEIMSHQADIASQDGVGFRLRSTPRRHLEGFDFMEIATEEHPIWPRTLDLCDSGKGWVDFARALMAITLFGRGFGELIEPMEAQPSVCMRCRAYERVPRGKDYLAVCVRDMQDILQKRGSQDTVPWRVIDQIYWKVPSKTFEQCSPSDCTSHDRVQVLLLVTPSKFRGRGLKNSSDLVLAPAGALLFGHSSRFPLRWHGRGDPEELKPYQEPDGGLESSMRDSGIGSSQASSSLSQSYSEGDVLSHNKDLVLLATGTELEPAPFLQDKNAQTPSREVAAPKTRSLSAVHWKTITTSIGSMLSWERRDLKKLTEKPVGRNRGKPYRL